MQASRIRRRDDSDSIPDEKVKEISKKMDIIKNSKPYVIVPNVINDTLTIKDILRKGNEEPINFSGEKCPFKRTMQTVGNAEEFMPEIFESLRRIFPGCTELVVKVITSAIGDTAQSTHHDFAATEYTKRMQNLARFQFSAIISVQDGTTILVG